MIEEKEKERKMQHTKRNEKQKRKIQKKHKNPTQLDY